MHILTRRKLTIASVILSVLGAVAFGVSLKTTSQQLPSSTSKVDAQSQQIEKSPDQPLRVLENDDSPLHILDARVKEISGSDFTKLTGQKTSLVLVCSVPEVHLLNSSSKTITGFILVIRDPVSKNTRGIVQSKVSIAQGDTYVAARQSFIQPEWTSVVDQGGQIKPRFATPGIDSEKYWISFAERSDLFVTVARVNFQDGSSWTVKEGGDIR